MRKKRNEFLKVSVHLDTTKKLNIFWCFMALLLVCLIWTGKSHAEVRAYIANYSDDTVSVIRTYKNVIATVNVGNGPYGVAAAPNGNCVYVTNRNDDTVSVIQTSDNTVIDTVNVGDDPFSQGKFIASVPTPEAPINPTANPVSSSQIDLYWTDNSSNEMDFEVERKTGSVGPYSQIDTVTADVTSYNDTGLSESTSYYYGVRAYNSAEDSNYSNEADATTSNNDLAVDFGSLGLWYYNSTSWSRISTSNPQWLTAYNGSLAADFGATYGLYQYDGSAWTQISTSDADNTGNTMVSYNNGLAVDFGSSGLYYYNGTSWSQLSTNNPEWLAAYNGTLGADFGAYGLYSYNGSAWSQISTGNADNAGNTMVAYNNGLAVDFGSLDLYYYNGTSWSQLSTNNPEWLTAYNGSLVGDFGSTWGLWQYDGTSWTQISTSDADNTGNTMVGYNNGLAVDFGSYYNDGDGCTNSGFPMGINLAYHNHWQSQIMFVDVMKRSNSWVSNVADQTDPRSWTVWDTGVDIPADSNGYPLELPYVPASGDWAGVGQSVTSIINNAIGGKYPSGTYTLIFEGTGEIRLSYDFATQSFTTGGTYQVSVTPSNDGLRIDILSSSASDPIKNIRIIYPGHESTYSTSPFYPPIFELLRGYTVIRPMATMIQVNYIYPCDDSTLAVTDVNCTMSWSNRMTTSYFSQGTERGMAWENMIDFINNTNADFWVTPVHAATDDYFRGLAQLLKERLNTNKNIYLELSNETWNSADGFPACAYFQNMGVAENLDSNTQEAGEKYFIKRTVEMWDIFNQVFAGSTARIKKLLPAQGHNSWNISKRIEYLNDTTYNPVGYKADALAVAEYFAGNVIDTIYDNNETETITIDQVMDRIEASLTTLTTQMQADKALADAANLPMITYESGTHVVNYNHQNNTTLSNLMIAANRHSRMYNIFNTFFDIWNTVNPDGLLMNFVFIDYPRIWGSFGIMEYMDQPASEAHKYRAIKERICPEAL